MTASVGSPEQNNASQSLLTALKDHFVWVSPVAVILASLIGLLNLLVFTWYINRPELFSRSLEFGPSLALLMLSYLMILAGIVGSMLITSYFFALTLQGLQPKPEYTGALARGLFFRVMSGMASMVLVLVVGAVWHAGALSGWWMLAIFVLPVVLSWSFIVRHRDQAKVLSGPIQGKRKLLLCAGVAMGTGLVAMLGILPAWYATFLYEGSGNTADWAEAIKLALTCLITMAGSLAPAVGYYLRAGSGVSAQRRGALIGLGAFLAFMVVTSPSLFSVASVGSVRLLGFSEREVRTYLVDQEQYPASSMSAAQWSITPLNERKYAIRAFSLYAYGALNLLCPQALKDMKLKELKQHTGNCIPFEKGSVKTQ